LYSVVELCKPGALRHQSTRHVISKYSQWF